MEILASPQAWLRDGTGHIFPARVRHALPLGGKDIRSVPMAIGFLRLTIISPLPGSAVAQAVRDAGYAVTEISARGRR